LHAKAAGACHVAKRALQPLLRHATKQIKAGSTKTRSETSSHPHRVFIPLPFRVVRLPPAGGKNMLVLFVPVTQNNLAGVRLQNRKTCYGRVVRLEAFNAGVLLIPFL